MDKIEQILNKREALDAQLEKSMTPIVVMFTDIKGSTAFYENRGDIDGLAMVHRHNRLLFPLITDNRGKVIKTVGDAIMAVFSDGRDAIRAAVAMQQALRGDNESKSAGNQIHIRIGIHSGLGLFKDGDYYGDAVNTASRVEHESQPDEIYISDSLVASARLLGATTTYVGEAELKGKAEKIKLLSVEWRNYTAPLKAAPSVGKYILLVAAVLVIVGLIALKNFSSASKTANVTNGTASTSAPAASAVTHEELADLLFQDAAIQKLLAKDGQLPTREALLGGELRGLATNAAGRTQPVSRAEMALVLEDLWIRATGKPELATNRLDADESPFEDVPTGNAAFNAVMNVTEHKWLEAESAKRFNAQSPITPMQAQRALEKFLASPPSDH